MRIFSIFILSISMVFIGQGIPTDAADIVTLNLSPSAGKPLFPSSVVSNDIDFIKSTDASVAYCIAFQKTGRAKMVDKRHNRLLTLNVSFFCRAICRWNAGRALGASRFGPTCRYIALCQACGPRPVSFAKRHARNPVACGNPPWR